MKIFISCIFFEGPKMNPFSQSIQGRIILFMVALGILIGLATGLPIIQTNKNELIALEKETMTQTVAMAGQKLHNDLQELSQDVSFLAGTPPIEGIIRSQKNGGLDPLDGSTETQWLDRLATIFENMLHAKSDYLKCRYIGVADQGRELVRVGQTNGMIERVPIDELQQKGKESYFQGNMEIGRVSLSKINLERENGVIVTPHQPVIRASIPVFDGDQFFGLIIINMNYEKRLKLVADQLANFQEVMITNDRGDYLYHKDHAKTFGFDLEKRHIIYQDIKEFAPFFKASHSLKFVEFQVDGNRFMGYIQKFPFVLEPDRFLGVAVSHPLKGLFQNTHQTMNQGVLIILAGILLSALLAFRFSRRLTKPLQDISTAAQTLAEGEFQVDLPTEEKGEVGQLARSLEAMAQRIKDRTLELQKSEAYNRAILDNALDCIITINQKGIILTANPALKTIFGYEMDEVIGCNVKMLMPSPEFERHDSYLEKYLLTQVKTIINSTRKVTGLRKDGTQVPLNLSVNELIMGKERFFTGFLKDITQEEEKRRHDNQLAGLAEIMSSSKDSQKSGMQVLSYMARFLDIQIGAIYFPLSEDTLVRIATYSWNDIKHNKMVQKGEGLVGQVAIDHQICILDQAPDGYYGLKTGAGNFAIKQILIYPILFDNELVAIFELGSLNQAHREVRHFMDAASHLLGVAFKTSQTDLTR